MTTTEEIFNANALEIVHGPGELKLSLALIVRDQEPKRTVEFTIIVDGSRLIVPVQVDTLGHGVTQSDWFLGGLIADSLIKNDRERARVQAALGWISGREAWMRGRLEKPFYWATYSTNINLGRIWLLEEPFVPYDLR